jgi:lactoylglutathione lyase
VFYANYFGATADAPYTNPAKGFESCFPSFTDRARIEVMRTTRLAPPAIEPGAERIGLTHLAIAVGSDAIVDRLTQRLKDDGFPVQGTKPFRIRIGKMGQLRNVRHGSHPRH